MLNVKANQQFAHSFYNSEVMQESHRGQESLDKQRSSQAGDNGLRDRTMEDRSLQQRFSQQSHNSSKRSHQTNATSISVRNPTSMLTSHQQTPSKDFDLKVNHKKLLKMAKNRTSDAHQPTAGSQNKNYSQNEYQNNMQRANRKKDEEMFSLNSSQAHACRLEDDSEFADSVARINRQGCQDQQRNRDAILELEAPQENNGVQKLDQQPFSFGTVQTQNKDANNQHKSIEAKSQPIVGNKHMILINGRESLPEQNNIDIDPRDFKANRDKIDLLQDSFEANEQVKNQDGCSPSWCDSQINQYPENDFHFESNSVCQKTAVWQDTKMAELKGTGVLQRNSTASLGQLSRIEKEGSSTYINDTQLRHQVIADSQINETELGKILDDSRMHEDIQEFSDLIIQGHAMRDIQIEALDQNLLDLNHNSQQKFKNGKNISPSSKGNNDSLVHRNLDETIEKFKAYKNQLVHANDNSKPLAITTKQNSDELSQGCLYEIQRLEQYSPSVDRLNRDDDFEDDIYNRPTIQLSRQSEELDNQTTTFNNRIDLSDGKDYKIDESLRQELRSQNSKQHNKQTGKDSKFISRTGKMKDATTTEFNFTFNQQNNPVQQFVNQNQRDQTDDNKSPEHQKEKEQSNRKQSVQVPVSKIIQKNQKNFQKINNRSEARAEPTNQSGKQTAATEKQNQKRVKNLCKKIQLFSPQQSNRADRQNLKRHDLIYPSQGQSALSDSIKKVAENAQHNMSYDQNSLHSNLIQARPQLNTQGYDIAQPSESQNDCVSSSHASNQGNKILQNNFQIRNSRQKSRGKMDEASYLQKKAQTLVSGMAQSTRNHQAQDEYARQESDFAKEINPKFRGYNNLAYQQYAQNNYSNIDKMENRCQNLDLSATFEGREIQLQSEARIGKTKPQTCQNTNTKKMSFSNKSFLHGNNEKLPYKNLAMQNEVQINVQEHHQKPAAMFYKSSKTKPQVALDIFNELHGAQVINQLGMADRRLQSKSQKRINHQLKSQSPEKLRHQIGHYPQQSFAQNSVRLPSIQNRQVTNNINNGGGSYLPSIVQSPNNQFNSKQIDENICTILSDGLSSPHRQQQTANAMTAGYSISNQSSRRIGKRDYTRMQPIEKALLQGPVGFSSTPISGEMPWEGSSPKNKYAQLYAAQNEQFNPQQHTPMSQAIPDCSSFNIAEPYKYRYQQNVRSNKASRMFGNQRNSLRDNQAQNNNNLLLPSHSINNSMSNEIPTGNNAKYDISVQGPVAIVDDCHLNNKKIRSRQNQNKQISIVLGQDIENFDPYQMPLDGNRQMYSGLGMDQHQKDAYQAENQIQNDKLNYLNVPLSEYSENIYLTQEHKANNSMATCVDAHINNNFLFNQSDLDLVTQQNLLLQQSTFEHRHRQILNHATAAGGNSHISSTADRSIGMQDLDQCSLYTSELQVPSQVHPEQSSATPWMQGGAQQQQQQVNSNHGGKGARGGVPRPQLEEGIYIQGHRDIKSSSKLPQAFRIVRTNQHKNASTNRSSKKNIIKNPQQVLNKQLKSAQLDKNEMVINNSQVSQQAQATSELLN